MELPLGQIVQGDSLEVLRTFTDRSVQCVVTSPPYWGLRDYGEPGQGGQEPAPEAHVEWIVGVWRELRRVLRDDGTVWLNYGDCYAGGGNGGGGSFAKDGIRKALAGTDKNKATRHGARGAVSGLKPKDLVGMPWRVALALQEDGWWLRSSIIWAKPNPMPESVTDRPASSHEYVFLFAKGQWKSRVVKFSNLPSEHFHFNQHLGLDGHPVRGAARMPVDLAASILNGPQLQNDFRLPPFYAEEWKQRPDGSDSDFVRGLPIKHRPAIWAARFLAAQATTKQFMCELNRLWVTLSDGDKFLERWTASKIPNAPSISSDGEGTIAVHYPGEICKVNFLHGEVTISQPSRCSYFYDADAVRETSINKASGNIAAKYGDEYGRPGCNLAKGFPYQPTGGRNLRDVWTIATQPYPGAHFATFPEKLVEPCIKAGTSEKGACPDCGAPWVREVEKPTAPHDGIARTKNKDGTASGRMADVRDSMRAIGHSHDNPFAAPVTTGWRQGCDCPVADPVPCVVLDPFAGAGTVGIVVARLRREFVGIDLAGGDKCLGITSNPPKKGAEILVIGNAPCPYGTPHPIQQWILDGHTEWEWIDNHHTAHDRIWAARAGYSTAEHLDHEKHGQGELFKGE